MGQTELVAEQNNGSVADTPAATAVEYPKEDERAWIHSPNPKVGAVLL
jgi:hypothetical protein